MKKIYSLLFAALVSSTGFSQITLDSADLFQAGDKFDMMEGKNPSLIDVKGTGSSSWDFSGLIADSVVKISTRIPDANNFPIDTMFPSANTVFNHGAEGITYLITGSDSLMMDGVLDYNFVLGVKMDINFKKDVTLMEFPFTYTDNFNTNTVIDTIVDTVVLFYDKVRIVANLGYYSEAEGYGNLKTAQTNFNTLKVYSLESRDIKAYGRNSITKQWDASPVYAQIDSVHKYRWFAKNKGYQVAEAITDERDGICTKASYLLNDSIFAYVSDKKDAKCFGEANGEAEVTVVGGSGIRTIQWGASAGSQNAFKLTNLAKGKHFYTVTDQITNSTFTDSVNILEPDSILIITVSKVDEGIEGKNGSIEVNVTGGTPNFTFKWDKSSSIAKKASDLAGGTHKIEVTDGNGCVKTYSETIGSFLSVKELSNGASVLIYPNPTSGMVTITSNGIATLNIYSTDGKVVLSKDFIDATSVDLIGNSGVFVFTVQNAEGLSKHQIIVE